MPDAPRTARAANWAPGRARILNAAEVSEAVVAPDASTCSHQKGPGRSLGSEAVGLRIQRVPPGKCSSLEHRHLFQEEMVLVLSGEGVLLHGSERIPVRPMDCVAHLPSDPAAHCFENTGTADLVILACGNRFRHEVCLYPEEGLAFVEGLGADIPISPELLGRLAK